MIWTLWRATVTTTRTELNRVPRFNTTLIDNT